MTLPSANASLTTAHTRLNTKQTAILRLLLLALAVASIALLLSPSAGAQTGQWTWVSGSTSTFNQSGVYGTKGTGDTGNLPGSRSLATTWVDPSGDFWLFGGVAVDSAGTIGILNDLWKFDPSTGEWTYVTGSKTYTTSFVIVGTYGVQGTPDPANTPGGRAGAAGWTDASGNLWLFGGDGSFTANNQAGPLNDLWEFTPSNGEWTWMGGANTSPVSGPPPTIPAGRYGAYSWTDANGLFWLFGGQSVAPGHVFTDICNTCQLNDLWNYNPNTSVWSLVSGSATGAEANGVYGVLGYDGPATYPGNRTAGNVYLDSNGDPWLFGGEGFDASFDVSYFDDFFRFNPANSEWAWMGGNQVDSQFSVNVGSLPVTTYYGDSSNFSPSGLPAASALPASRTLAGSWNDPNGNFWLFGGSAFDSSGANGDVNELWEYDPFVREWTWMGGSQLIGSTGATPGVFGIKGTPSASNIPSGRAGAATWTDTGGNVWLFGGASLTGGTTSVELNDLWEFQPPAPADTPTFSVPAGSYLTTQSVIISDTTPGAVIYYTTDGKTPVTNSPVYSASISISTPQTIRAIAVAPGLSISPITAATYNVTLPTPTPTITPAPGTYTTTQNVHIADSLPGTSIFYTTDGSDPTTGSTPYTASFLVSSNETVKALAVKPGVTTPSVIAANAYTIAPVTLTPGISPVGGTYVSTQLVTIVDKTPGAVIYYTLDNSTPTTASAVYSSAISISSTTPVKAAALAPGGTISAIASANYTITTAPTAPMPSVTPASGTYTTPQNVHIGDSLGGASIYYTTDGSTPTTGSKLYTASFVVSANTPVQAIAVKPGVASQSPIGSATYVIAPVALTPGIYPVAGTYFTTQSVTILDKTPGAVIYYTLDGSTPTTSSAVYSGAISVASTTPVKAAALAPGGTISAIASSTYTITTAPPAPMPVISPAPGTYTKPQVIHIADSLVGSSVYYTTDGSTPTTSSKLYTASFVVSSTTTVQAIAIKPGSNSQSPTASNTITIQ